MHIATVSATGQLTTRFYTLLFGLALVGLTFPSQVQAETCTTVTGGDWTADGTWDCGTAGNAGSDGVPGSGDTAEIGHSVIVDSDVTVGTVNVNSGGFLDPPSPSTNLVITLTVEGDFSVNDSGSTINGRRSVGGDASELGIDAGGGISNNGTIDLSGVTSAVFEAQGSLTNNSGAAFTTGAIRVDIRSSVTNDGTLTISNKGTLEIGGNFTNNSDFDASSPSLVDFAGELVAAGLIASQSLSGNFFSDDAFENVDVGADAFVDPDDVLNQSSTNNNPVEINGSLNVATGGKYGQGDATSQTVNEGSDLTYNGSAFSVNGDLFANVVTFDASSGTTTVSGAVFAEVKVTDQTNVAVGSSDFAVIGLVTINNGGSLDVSSTSLNLLGDLQVNGTLNASSGTVSFRGKGRSTCCSGSSFETDPDKRTSNEVQEVIGTSNIGFGTLKIEDINQDGTADSDDTPDTDVDFVTSASDILVEGDFTINEALASTARPFTLEGAKFEIKNSGDFEFTEDRLLTFSAGSGQTYSTTNASTLQVPSLQVDKPSGTVNLSDPIIVQNLLDMVSGTLAPGANLQIWEKLRLAGGVIDVNLNNGTVTLVSGDVPNPDGNGQINVDAYVEYVDSDSDGTNDGSVNGDITFQRQVGASASQDWYYLTTPVDDNANFGIDVTSRNATTRPSATTAVAVRVAFACRGATTAAVPSRRSPNPNSMPTTPSLTSGMRTNVVAKAPRMLPPVPSAYTCPEASPGPSEATSSAP